MRKAAMAVSFAALAGTILPAFLFFAGTMGLDAVKGWMLGATAVWFAATPVWMERKAG